MRKTWTRYILASLVLGILAAGWFARQQIGSAQATPLLRGDADGDGRRLITDAIFILNFLFLGGTPPDCVPLADVDANGTLNITDGISLLGFLFLGGDPPPALTEEEIRECGGTDPAARGREIYHAPDPDRNRFAFPFSCSTCHATVPDDQNDMRLIGFSLHDAVRRPSFKLGRAATFLEAANTCREHWMDTTPWAETDEDFQAVVAYLESIAPPGDAPALNYTVVKEEEIPEGESQGDPVNGCRIFHRTCVVCHGESGQGSELGPAIAPPASFNPKQPALLRFRVRVSSPRNLEGSVYAELGLNPLFSGFMPFWAAEKLSREELEDLVAYLRQEAPQAPGDCPPAQ